MRSHNIGRLAVVIASSVSFTGRISIRADLSSRLISKIRAIRFQARSRGRLPFLTAFLLLLLLFEFLQIVHLPGLRPLDKSFEFILPEKRCVSSFICAYSLLGRKLDKSVSFLFLVLFRAFLVSSIVTSAELLQFLRINVIRDAFFARIEVLFFLVLIPI